MARTDFRSKASCFQPFGFSERKERPYASLIFSASLMLHIRNLRNDAVRNIILVPARIVGVTSPISQIASLNMVLDEVEQSGYIYLAYEAA